MQISQPIMFSALAVVLTACSSLAEAQSSYPSKSIRLVVPYAPGASSDQMARLTAQKLTGKFGQQVFVDNRPGGNSVIGTGAVAKALPDGYAILWVSTAFVTTPTLLPDLPYDPVKDFDGVATFATTRNVLVLNPLVPADTVLELIALAKAKPGQLNYASSGAGTAPHMASELFNMVAGVKTQHIPFKGTAPAIAEVVSGRVQIAFAGASTVLPFVKSGKLKAIAVAGSTRLAALPQVPTFTDAGLPAYDRKDAWHGILAPMGTPKDILEKLSSEVRQIQAMPDVQDYLAKQGMEAITSTPSQTSALIKADIETYAKIIKFANIKLGD